MLARAAALLALATSQAGATIGSALTRDEGEDEGRRWSSFGPEANPQSDGAAAVLEFFPLHHAPHAISAGRWGGNDTAVYRRRLEALEAAERYEAHQRRLAGGDWDSVRGARGRRLGHQNGATSPEPSLSEAPLWEGIGTHYVHIYVGTPPQRVSVIVDTGSHHTAFPCDGCLTCGEHTDPYFDPKKSSTSQTVSCSQCPPGARCVGHRCESSLTYAEGSSWKAIQVVDKLWPGGLTADSQPAAEQNEKLAVDFMFGCQLSETGLFRTQRANGIMGLSANSHTLLPQMRSQRKSASQAFSLCLTKGGGIMTIGGADAAMNDEPMVLVPTMPSMHGQGWYTVHLDFISVGGSRLEVPDSAYTGGKGVIVDTGTTDTYLPRKVAGQFTKAWKERVGRDYAIAKMTFTDEQFAQLPVVSFAFKDVNGKPAVIEMPPDAYMEKSAEQFIPRIYLTGEQGVVLGANFLQDHNVLFDQDNKRVGFARSRCDYAAHVSSV